MDIYEVEDYIKTILGSDGSDIDSNSLDQVLNVMLSELSLRPFNLTRVMNCLIQCLSYCSQNEHVQVGVVQEPEQLLYNWAIGCLVRVVELAPQSMSNLLSLLEKNKVLTLVSTTTYVDKKAHLQISYVTNLLRLCSHFPSSRRQLLEIAIHFVLKVDLRCPREYIFAVENQSDDMFVMDEDKSQNIMVDGISYQLDILMELLFKYIYDTCYVAGKLHAPSTSSLFVDLMNIFEHVILPTYKCSHVPFLIFYICSFKQELSDAFLDYLWKKTINDKSAIVIQQIAASYISSFLARSKFITFITVRTSLEIMVTWLQKYIDQHDGCGGSQILHGTFYAVCQAVLYVIAFLHSEMLQLPNTATFLTQLNLMRIVTCQLNPLKPCSKEVVLKFAAVLKNYQIAFCDTLIAKNERDYLKSNFIGDCDNTTRKTKEVQLDLFFPFDPYMLKKSGKFIADLYREYTETLKPAAENQTADDDDFLKHDAFSTSINSFDDSDFHHMNVSLT